MINKTIKLIMVLVLLGALGASINVMKQIIDLRIVSTVHSMVVQPTLPKQ